MHELGIANETLDVALSEAHRHAAKKVTAIRLCVGVLRAVEPGNLSFLFEHLARGTLAEGARLDIEEEAIRVACPACGDMEADSFTSVCPRCKGTPVTASGGDSLSILSIEIDI